jgi:alpha-mannosidase
LPDDVKRIELCYRVRVDLLYAKQASYFAFPWALSSPTFRYDIANGFVDPERDLLEGACSEWFSVQHWVSTADAHACVDLAVVDAPLVCLGDINRGYWPRRFTKRSSTVFSYVLNNLWSSKWAGQKSWELLNRYAITSGPRFDPARAGRLGREARCPLEIAEIKTSDKLPEGRGRLPAAGASFAALAPENVVITALKAAEDDRGLIVRALEIAGRESDGILRLPLVAVSSAKKANAVEVPGKPLPSDAHGVRFHIRPYQALTIRLATR